jgi:hypothetical protein
MPSSILNLAARLAVAGVLAACADSQPERSAEPADPVIGTWKLNVAKSSFSAPQAPISQTVTFEPTDAGTKVTSATVAPNGDTTRTTYTAKYDGKRYPISGTPNVDSVSFARLDARTVERFDTKGNTFVGSVTRIISADGKTLTVMNKPVAAQGRVPGSVLVYDRQ